LIDDNVFTIKEKLFAYTSGLICYPGWVKLETYENGRYQVIRDMSSLLFSFDTLPEVPKIYLTNISDVITEEYNVGELYASLGTENFDKVYLQLKQEYVEMSEDDFECVIKATLFDINKTLYSHLEPELTMSVQTRYASQKSLLGKLDETEKGLESFNRLAYEINDYSEYFNVDNKGGPIFTFTNVSLTIKGNNNGNGVKGRFIKLEKVFNILELTEEIPFVAIETVKSKEEPMVKVYNRLMETVPEKEIKSWVLNEKKKQNLVSYKKIKGLLLKYRVKPNVYMSINLQNNGLMTAKISFLEDDKQTDIENIIDTMKRGVDYVVESINKLQSVFSQTRRIDVTSKSDVMIDSLTGSASTNFRVNISKFTSLLNNEYIKNNIFELKDTLSHDVLSVYYKKFGKRENEENESERKGITVNVKDNPYKMDSSIVTIYGAYNINQIATVVKQIVIVSRIERHNDAMTGVEYEEQKLKEKSHIKNLRKQGVTILSTKCQKPRQPNVDGKQKPQPSSHVLEFEGMKYVCPKKDYPHPGFTNQNIVCCFKKDQRRRDSYIRNTKSNDFDVMVQPSNFKIKVRDSTTGLTYQTYALKVVSDYVDGFDENNSMSRYYFLSEQNELVPITSAGMIKKLEIEEENNIWLDRVQLTKIISEPPKNKCNFPPNMNKLSSSDVNAPCKHHRKNKVFGYNLNSYPCCFDKERDTQIKRKKKVSDITKQHILISDKILDYQRLGNLPSGLDALFNDIVKQKSRGKFYRMGVVQNSSAFLNAILLATGNKIAGKVINNSNEFKKYIINSLSKNSNDFEKLNGGNLALKYGNLTNYANSLLAPNRVVYWTDVVDVIQRLTGINCLVLDIPYKSSESTKIADYENIRLVCNPTVKYDKENPFVILIKRINTFEVVTFLKESNGEKTDVKLLFNKTETGTFKTNIVNFLMDYYTTSCVKENVFPEVFPYTEMYTLLEIIALLDETPHQIIGQAMNSFKKVDYVFTRRGVLLPIKESGIIDGLTLFDLKDLRSSGKLLELHKYRKGVMQINRILKAKSQRRMITLLGITLDHAKKVTAVFTGFGQMVPVAEKDYAQTESNLKVLDFNYYPDVNQTLESNSPVVNDQVKYSKTIQSFKQVIFRIKSELASVLSVDEAKKSAIMAINKSVTQTRFEKVDKLVEIFKTVDLKLGNFSVVDSSTLDFILRHIANEVLNDNVENLLLNNLVTSELFDPNEVLQRDAESVLLNIDDVKKWIKKYDVKES
jgi:hypothetical protein